jgi:hypothetical protein
MGPWLLLAAYEGGSVMVPREDGGVEEVGEGGLREWWVERALDLGQVGRSPQ